MSADASRPSMPKGVARLFAGMSWLIKGYFAVLTIAGLALVGAQASGALGLLFLEPKDATGVRVAMMAGWCVGAGLGVVTVIRGLGKWSRRGSDSANGLEVGVRDEGGVARDESVSVMSAESGAESASVGGASLSESQGGKFKSIVTGVIGIGLAGAMVGGMFGGSLVLIWFSLGCSPLAVGGWGESIELASWTVSKPGAQRSVLATRDPIVIGLVGVPLLFGAVAGAAFGFAASLREGSGDVAE